MIRGLTDNVMFGLDLSTSFNPWTCVVVSVACLIAYNYVMKEAWKMLPPGPPALPILGSLPFLGFDPDIREPLMKMAKKYGDVFTLYMGMRRVIVLNGYDVIKEAFVQNAYAFSGRPDVYIVTGITHGYGMVSCQGDFWREQRRHSMHIMRNMDFGRSNLEDRILEEISFFHKELLKNTDRPFYPQAIVQRSVANVLASVAFGKRWDYEDPVLERYLDVIKCVFEKTGDSGILLILPSLRHLPGDLFGIKELQTKYKYMLAEFQRMADEHRADGNDGKDSTDFMGAYLSKINDEKSNPDTTFTDRQLVAIMADFFGAGTETASTTLQWGIIYMTLYPQIQDRVYAEIDDVIGANTAPRMHYRSQMPYTEACIAEIQRLGDVAPLGIAHGTIEDVQLRGFFIPKGTMVVANMYSVHRDPNVWPEPLKFNPERFLDADGKVVKREELIPFSVGKRLCLGESLARKELFLYFTSMIQHVRFELCPDEPIPNTVGTPGVTNVPRPFKIIMRARKEDEYNI